MPSTAIKHFYYDESSQILLITFITNLTYRYKDVPLKVYQMLKAAGSKGRYFNYHIKGNFEYELVDA